MALLVVLSQQILAVVVPVGRACHRVDVLPGRPARQVAQEDRALVVELDEDDRAVDTVVEGALRAEFADPGEIGPA